MIFLRNRVVAAFAPDDIADLVLWLDASDSGTITSSGSPAKVSAWADKSTSGLSATQSTGTKQPTTGATTQNGLNVLDFDGGDTLAVTGLALTAHTIFAVIKATSTGKMVMEHGPNANSNNGFMFYGGGNPGHQIYRSSANGGVMYSDVADSAWHVFTLGFNGTKATTTVLEDGTSIATTSYGSDVGTASVSATLNIASRNGSDFVFAGSWAELIVYTAALGASDREAVESYLQTKWGTP